MTMPGGDGLPGTGLGPGAVRHAGPRPAPAGALAAGEGDMAARVTRLFPPVRPLPAAANVAICLAAALLVAATVALLVL